MLTLYSSINVQLVYSSVDSERVKEKDRQRQSHADIEKERLLLPLNAIVIFHKAVLGVCYMKHKRENEKINMLYTALHKKKN